MKKVTPIVINCDACEKYISYSEGRYTTRLHLSYDKRWFGQEGVTVGMSTDNYPEYDFCDMDCLVKWIKREDDKEI